MSLRLYDTATRSVREFVPRQPGTVSIYLCGATVQAPPHIGHIRGSVVFDILRRWLERNGQRVVLCRNVTDIEDKVIARSAAEGVPAWEVAARNEREFAKAYDLLSCLPPTVEPRATGHVPEILALIRRLIDRGYAYAAGGDVYFDVSSWPDYGALSRQDPADMQPAEDVGAGKRDPRDFALWKAAKPGEPTWESPWGAGRPGWHIECSAMAARYLGSAFDLHGAGMDLIFPHNENEIAQSRAAGYGFAAHWMHNGLVTTAGEKMSKSLGNSLLVSEIVTRIRPVELRYYLAAPHYRSVIEASPESMAEAATAYQRLEGFAERAGELVGESDPAQGTFCADFTAAMDDDLHVPRALAAIHEVVREGNRALAAGEKDAVRGALASVRAMLGVLGLDPLSARWRQDGGDLSAVVDALVSVALEAREAARERREYAAADSIRDRLAAAGITVEDTPNGPRWSVDR